MFRNVHVWPHVMFAAAIVSVVIADAAPKPLPDLTPEEIQVRALVQPLRDGITEGEALQPLHEWLDARESAGKDREAERELRRTLKRIDDEYQKDLLRAAEWIRTLQIHRSRLYTELAEDTISLRRATERSNDLPPVPLAEELLPGRGEISDAFLAGDSRAMLSSTPVPDVSEELSSESGTPAASNVESTDLDASRLLDRLTLDLTALGHLLHECDNEYEQEKERHRAALEALTKLLRARRTTKRSLL